MKRRNSSIKPIDIGLDDNQRAGSCSLLNRMLCNEMILLIKTRKFHWDVSGPQFMTLHKLWDKQYESLNDIVDEIAERVRSLGGYPVGTTAGFLEHATLAEHPGQLSLATEAVAALVADHESVVRSLRQFVDKSDEEYGDRGTSDFFTRLLQAHEEMAWMLRSFLEGEAVQSSTRPLEEDAVPAFA